VTAEQREKFVQHVGNGAKFGEAAGLVGVRPSALEDYWTRGVRGHDEDSAGFVSDCREARARYLATTELRFDRQPRALLRELPVSGKHRFAPAGGRELDCPPSGVSGRSAGGCGRRGGVPPAFLRSCSQSASSSAGTRRGPISCPIRSAGIWPSQIRR